MVFVRDLFSLESFREMEALCGSAGMNRRVAWPNIAQTVSIEEWLVGGDVILMTGIGMEVTEELLQDIVRQAVDKEAACLIILQHPEHIPVIFKTVIDYAKSRGFAVISAPWNTKLSNVIRDISSAVYSDQYNQMIQNELLERVLSGNSYPEDGYVQKQLEACHLYRPHVVAVVKCGRTEKETQIGFEEGQQEKWYFEITAEIQNYFRHQKYIIHKDEWIYILEIEERSYDEIEQIWMKISDEMDGRNKGCELRIGIGEISTSPETLGKSYKQAQKAVELVRGCGVICYQALGILRLLMEVPDQTLLIFYMNQYLGPLKQYDCRYNRELLRTLYAYLESDGNITEAAESLFIHRNTMLKRIDKIEEILKMSLEKADVKNTLYNCYLIDKYIK